MNDSMQRSSAPPGRPGLASAVQVSFPAQVELLHWFLIHRASIVDRIEQLLNCQKKPLDYQQDLALLSRHFKDCFYSLPPITREQAALRDQLEHAHWASGFKPRAAAGNDIIDAAALMQRAFHLWQQTRWPGQKGRVRYAHTLFNVYLLRCLSLLLMRLWDDAETGSASARLAQVQAVLDLLWLGSPTDQPVLVRNVRWLVPVAMSPTTDELAGYFEVAAKISATLPAADQLAIQTACVQTGSAHLRSQLRHLCVQRDVPMDEHGIVLLTRVSNALDISLLMEGLVSLLKAYEHSVQTGDNHQRLVLAAAIGEGLSPDPELFVNRLDLLGPYTMIEHLFVSTDAAGHAVYTAMGQRHLQLLQDYQALIKRLAQSLHEDCQHSRPQAGRYSPYGVLFGFASNLLELMAFKSLQLEAPIQFSLEDAFTDGSVDKRAWVNGWRNLPHITPAVVKQFEYPEAFATAMQARVEQALQRCVAGNASAVVTAGKLYIEVEGEQAAYSHIAELPQRYRHSSDPQLVAAHQADAKDEADLLHCRLEGEYLVSYPTAGGWVGLSKDLLTDVVGEGRAVKLSGLPRAAAEALKLLCPAMIA